MNPKNRQDSKPQSDIRDERGIADRPDVQVSGDRTFQRGMDEEPMHNVRQEGNFSGSTEDLRESSPDVLGDVGTTRFRGDSDEELRGLEQRYWQALKEHDVRTMKELTDEPCLLAGAQGVRFVDPDDLESMEMPRTQLDDFEIRDLQVRRIGEDVAILAYQVHEELTIDGEHVSLDAADASTWICRDGRWVCALHAEALSGDPYGRDRNVGSARSNAA